MKTLVLSITLLLVFGSMAFAQEKPEVTQQLKEKYNYVSYDVEKNYYCVKKNNLYGACDQNGTEIIPCKYGYVHYSKVNDSIYFYMIWLEGYKPSIKRGVKQYQGLCDKNGNIIFPCEYGQISVSQDNEGYIYFSVYKNGHKTWSEGNIIIPLFQNKSVFISKEKKGKWSILDQFGNNITGKNYDDIKSIGYGRYAPDDRFSVKQSGKWGIVDRMGRTIIPFIYEDCYTLGGLTFLVKQSGKWGIIDINNELIIPFKYDDVFNEKLSENHNKTWKIVEKKQKAGIYAKLFIQIKEGLTEFESLSASVEQKKQEQLLVEKKEREDKILKAQDGDKEFQFLLYQCYIGGLEGFEKDTLQAIQWLSKSAEAGYPKAQTYLGQAYDEGIGMEKNTDTAMNWYQKAAQQGDGEAQYIMGTCYKTGYGGTVMDNLKAAEWYEKAAGQDVADAIKQFCETAVVIGHEYQEKKDYKNASKWFLKSAEKGNEVAQFLLGKNYHNGQGVEKDSLKAIEWLTKAATQNHGSASVLLGIIQLKANQLNEGFKWLKQGAELTNDPEVQALLASFYTNGVGCEANNSEAIKWYEKSYSNGNKEVKDKLTDLYYNAGVENMNKGYFSLAINYYDKVIKNEEHEAAYLDRGYCYFQQEQYNKAKSDFQRTLSINPNNTVASQNLTTVTNVLSQIQQEKQREEAINNAYNELIGKARNAYSRRDYINSASYALGALQYRKTALAYNIIGDCYYSNQLYADAIEYYRVAQSIEPNNEYARKSIKNAKILMVSQAVSQAAQGISAAFNPTANTATSYSIPNSSSYGQGTYNTSPSQASSNSNLSCADLAHNRNTEQKLYNDHADALMSMYHGLNKNFSQSDRISRQSKMEQIRQKWESRGCDFYKSKWEDWDGVPKK